MARLSNLSKIFNRLEVNYSNLTNQLNYWLKSNYKKSSILFNSASPYGQILTVVKEFFIQNLLYVKNAVKQLDIEQANSVRTIRNIARISGHNSSRSMSAKGTLKFKLKQGINISQVVSGSQVTIYDNTILKNISNNLYYTLKIGTSSNFYTLIPGCQFFINIVQGRYEKTTFTGTGESSQSFSVALNKNSNIDNFDFSVSLNGINLEIKDHLYDMLPGQYACYTRTGFNGGLDIYFGNSINGVIPDIGSIIEVKYLVTNGTVGNIINNKINDFKFIDDIYDTDGNSLEASRLFDIFVETDINFASDGESVSYTKSIIPHVSRNFVLSTPSQFIYHLSKLNMFSKVNAFNTLDMIKIDINSDGTLDNINVNEMYLYLIPRITDYFIGDVNYFNVPLDSFYLDQTEKDRIINYLKIQGTLSITSTIKIINPIIKKYVMNIFIRRYDDISEENIRENIITTLSSYFSEYDRTDRIVKANIITELKNIDGIDSINLEFIGKENEDYHRDGSLLSSKKSTVIQSTLTSNTNAVNIKAEEYKKMITAKNNNTTKVNNYTSSASVGNSTIVSTKTTDYDAKKQIGIDPILGDIIIGNNDLVILRGGWKNRNGIFFSDDPKTTSGFSTINIIWKGTTTRN